jgi:hypothetical protein
METKHTKGPWSVSNRRIEANEYGVEGIDIDGAGDEIDIATVWIPEGDEDAGLYDAKLIAAAPEMLDALLEIREWYEANQHNVLGELTPICFSKGLSAILKATE